MKNNKPLGIAIIGTGKIADSYAQSLLEEPTKACLLAVHDIVTERADAFAARFGCKAYRDLDSLLSAPEVDIVLNLTIQQVHVQITEQALKAGKHVHSEKPLAGTLQEAMALLKIAEARGLRLSCAPFTFMGEAQQTFLKNHREGTLGKILVAYGEANWGPIELWNPRPIPFLQKGGGPLLDVGVYPLTLMTAALGPVKSVMGLAKIVQPQRQIATGDEQGRIFTVETPDQIIAGLEFENGTIGRLTAGFCSVKSKLDNGVEFHYEKGSLSIASHMFFNPAVERFDWASREWQTIPPVKKPYEGIQWGRAVFDLVDSLQNGTTQHCTGRHAYHVLDICLGIIESAELGRKVEIESRFDIPPIMPWA